MRGRTQIAAAVFAAAAMLVSCGGDDEEGGEDSTAGGGAQQSAVSSGVVDLRMKLVVDQTGGEGGSVTVRASGPFEIAGAGESPSFDLDVEGTYDNLTSSDEPTRVAGGLISTGERGFIRYEGFESDGDRISGDPGPYEIDPPLFAALQRAVESELSKPRGTLARGVTRETGVEVDGTTTDHVSGELRAEEVAGAVNELLADAEDLGLRDEIQLPEPEPGSFTGLERLVEDARFDIYLDPELGLLRRMTVDIALARVSVTRIGLDLDMTVSEVNEPQTIEAPADAKPFADLIAQPFVAIYLAYLGLPEAERYLACAYSEGSTGGECS